MDKFYMSDILYILISTIMVYIFFAGYWIVPTIFFAGFLVFNIMVVIAFKHCINVERGTTTKRYFSDDFYTKVSEIVKIEEDSPIVYINAVVSIGMVIGFFTVGAYILAAIVAINSLIATALSFYSYKPDEQ